MTHIKDYVLNKIETTDINTYPFYNLYIQDIFPEDFYKRLKDKMLYFKYNETLQNRNWDNPNFMNKKFHLTDINDNEINTVREVFDDVDIKNALMKKFYFNSYSDEMVFNIDELKYKPITYYVFNTQNNHTVYNFEMTRYLLSIEFLKGKDELTFKQLVDDIKEHYEKDST
jgi:hypothetical protein